jgi:hypothetical protein
LQLWFIIIRVVCSSWEMFDLDLKRLRAGIMHDLLDVIIDE